ncbi:MAG: putative addiction module antidote protein [Rickettsiales bacterium]|jgi:probable addiction module antidote protein|nr:putative addiction module antidote protein [Rickettsiales bacterium]
MALKTKKWDTAEHLRSPAEIENYLTESFAEGDEKQIIRALDNAVRAQGILSVARKIGRDRAGLYRALSGDKDPRFSTIIKAANACGGRISYVPTAIAA